MPDYKFVVLTNPVEGREDEYNKWYDETHLQDVLNLPGFIGAQRFEYADPLAEGPPKYRYLAIYDMMTDDVNATLATMAELEGTEKLMISEALSQDISALVYRVRGPRLIAD
jgi:hypothetical protein